MIWTTDEGFGLVGIGFSLHIFIGAKHISNTIHKWWNIGVVGFLTDNGVMWRNNIPSGGEKICSNTQNTRSKKMKLSNTP